MTSFPWVIFIALALVWLSASGAISDSLELNDCLKLAEIRNPRYKISSHAVDAANLSLKELEVQRYPQIKYKGSLEYAPISHHFGYDPSLTNGGLLGSQIVVEQTIYDGGQRRLKLKQLELDLARTGHEKRVSNNELRYDIEVAFTELLRAQAVADLKRRSHIQLQGYLKLVQRMQGGGQAGYTDVLKTKIQMSEANSEWNEAEVEMVVDNYTLADLIGLSKVDSLKIKGSLEDLDRRRTSALVGRPGRGAELWRRGPLRSPMPAAGFEDAATTPMDSHVSDPKGAGHS